MPSDTTIRAISAAAYRFPTESPESDGTLEWESTTMVVVEVQAGDCSGTGWTYGPATVAGLVRAELADIVVGRDAMDITGCFVAMVRAIRNVGRCGVGGQAISAVDTALWDLKSRLLSLPLHRLLGTVRTSIPVYGSGGFTSYDRDQMVNQLDHWTTAFGVRAVKIKIGEAGPRVALLVDANGGYGRKQSIRVMREVDGLDVCWFEEPVSSDDVDGLRSVRDAVEADVTAGEYGYDLYYFRRLCEARAVDCLQVDASRCGGITEWLRAAAVAAAYGLDVSGHCAGGSQGETRCPASRIVRIGTLLHRRRCHAHEAALGGTRGRAGRHRVPTGR